MKILFNFFIIMGSVLFSNLVYSQVKSQPFSEVETLQKNAPKLHLVFVHTQWCKYCKAMQQTSFKNEKIKKLLDDDFYFTAFDAEEKADINFLGKTFKYQPSGKNTGINQLNQYLSKGNNQEIYPRIAFLDNNGKVIHFLEGFVSARDLEKILLELKK